MEQVIGLGLRVRGAVLDIASLLKNEAAPGIVTLVLLALLVVALLWLLHVVRQRRAALQWLTRILSRAGRGAELSANISAIDQQVDQGGRGGARSHVAEVWREYRETLVVHDQDGKPILRNAVRPSTFFNLEDLHFGAGFWRIVPGLFVTVGLFLTFLGLISALNSMDLARDSQRALNDLLTIASAKFIMSLTGLFCSILFTMALRVGMGGVERSLHSLTRTIENRLSFISLEDLAVEQLAAARESREHFRQLSLEMVAELSRPFKEELPNAISASISSAMTPLISRMSEIGSQGVGDMVKDLSTQFSDDVGRALTKAAEQISHAGDRIGLLSDRLDTSSGRMGNEMEGAVARLGQAVEDLRNTMTSGAQSASDAFGQGAEVLLAAMNDTLKSIRDNTGEGARAISAAATEMRQAAEGIRAELESAAQQGAVAARHQIEAVGGTTSEAIGQAGRTLMGAFDKTAGDIVRAADEMSARAGERLLQPMDAIAERLAGMVSSLQDGSVELRRMSDGLRDGSQATERAAGTFRGAAEVLAGSAEPIRISVARIENSTTALSESTRTVADVMAQSTVATARQATEILSAARTALGAERTSIESTLEALAQALDQLKDQGETFDSIDTKLGAALDAYTKHVGEAVDTLFGHVKEMQNRLNPALDTMREVVDRAESFLPQQRRA